MVLRIGMVVPEETNCGIYTYSSFLLDEMQKIKGVEVESVSNTCGSNNSKYTGLAKYLDKSFDLVHVQYEFGRFGKLFISGTSTPAFYNAFSPHTKVVTTLHELPKSNNPFIRFMHERFLSTIISRSNAIIVHTQEMARLKERYPHYANKIHVIPHGMVTPKVLKEKTNLPPSLRGKKIIGFFGFVVPHKQVEKLIEALPSLPSDYEAVIAGGTQGHEEYVSSLKQMAEKLGVTPRIHWLGFIDKTKISEVLSWMDVLVFPYRQVTESGTLHISLGHHRIILASKLEAFKEIEDTYGCLRTFTDATEMISQIQFLASDEKTRKEMVSNMKRFTLDRNWKSVAHDHVNLYQEIK